MKKGINEVEIEAPTSTLKDVIGMISEIMENIPLDTESHVIKDPRNISYTIQSGRDEVGTETSNIPEINISKDDSLTMILSKTFRDYWGRTPRKLGEIREALQSYGLSYPKQSVALLRLAQSGKLRRFKNDGGEYVYTSSTTLMAENPIISDNIRLKDPKQYA